MTFLRKVVLTFPRHNDNVLPFLLQVVLTLAMLNFVMQATGRARDFASHALLALQGKEDSEVAPQILTFLKLIDVDT